MIIFYGIEDNYVDVTKKVLLYNYLFHDKELKKIYIPSKDVKRSFIFGDHVYGKVKNILIKDKNGDTLYDENTDIEFSININNIKSIIGSFTNDEKLSMIHNNTLFTYIKDGLGGDMKDEYDEQIMASQFIKEDSIVLELGANIGRNTITISRLLKDSRNLVSLETRPDFCKLLKLNRDNNKLKFNIQNSALSLRYLIQHKNSWNSIIIDNLDNIPEDYYYINTVSFDYLESRYLNGKHFDTIVADCEGALYYIFEDFPDILKNINTVIMENDYSNFDHKKSVDNFMINNGFICVYRKSGGWNPLLYNCFYETWIKFCL